METINYNENVRYGQNIEISINLYGGGNLNATAVHREAERTTTVNLEYNASTGERITEVTDKSAPFDDAFYSALDSKMGKIAESVNVGNDSDGEEA